MKTETNYETQLPINPILKDDIEKKSTKKGTKNNPSQSGLTSDLGYKTMITSQKANKKTNYKN